MILNYCVMDGEKVLGKCGNLSGVQRVLDYMKEKYGIVPVNMRVLQVERIFGHIVELDVTRLWRRYHVKSC